MALIDLGGFFVGYPGNTIGQNVQDCINYCNSNNLSSVVLDFNGTKHDIDKRSSPEFLQKYWYSLSDSQIKKMTRDYKLDKILK
jgi:hypothetical protein